MRKRTVGVVVAFVTSSSAFVFSPDSAFALTQAYDPSIGAVTLTLSANETVSITCANANGTGTVKVNAADLTGGPANCYDVQTITVTGSTGNETINLAGVTMLAFPSLISTTLTGGAGNDIITGSSWEDTINPGVGADTVNAGLSSDTVIWQVGDGSDTSLNGGGATANDGSDIVVVDGTSAADNLSVSNAGGQYVWTGSATPTLAFEGVTLNGGPYVAGLPNLTVADGDDRLTVNNDVVGQISVFGNGGADVLLAPFGSSAQSDLNCGGTWQNGDQAWYTATSSAAAVQIVEGVITQFGVSGDAFVSQCSVIFNGLTSSIAGGQFHPLTPTRVYDTRPGSGYIGAGGAFGANETRVMPVANAANSGVPDASLVSAVVYNVTVDDPQSDGFLKLFPHGAAAPQTSNINFVGGEVRANNTTVTMSASGLVAIYSSAATHVIVDVLGYFTSANVLLDPIGTFNSVEPMRVLDTRPGDAHVGTYVPGGVGSLPNGGDIALNINADVDGVLGGSSPTAVVLNVTGVNAQAPTFVTVYPSGSTRPQASNLNTAPNSVTPNLVTVPVGPDGFVRLYSLAAIDLVVDILGYFGGSNEVSTDGRFVALSPQRLFDSRAGSGYQGAATPITNVAQDMWCANLAGLPSGTDVGSVVFNATAIPFAASYVTMYPSDAASRPVASNLNAILTGRAVSNAAWVATSATPATLGGVRLFYSQSGELVVDVAGYFTAS